MKGKNNQISNFKNDLSLSYDLSDSFLHLHEYLPSVYDSKNSYDQLFTAWGAKTERSHSKLSMFERHKEWVEKKTKKISEITEAKDRDSMKECTFKPEIRKRPPVFGCRNRNVECEPPKMLREVDVDTLKETVFCTKKYNSLSPFQVNIAGCKKFQ